MRLFPFVLALLVGCQFDSTVSPKPDGLTSPTPPELPVTVSNNAAVLIPGPAASVQVISLAGLVDGKTWRHVSDRVFSWRSGDKRWRELAPIPGGVGRLAATAQTVAGQVYFFGGYTVSEDGAEVSTPDGYELNPATGTYRRLPDMPVAVDDAVSAVYADRYVFLVSGWHNNDNVDLVQVFDTQTHSWLAATPFPGPPVFGHSGGISGRTLIVCDGVKVLAPANDEERRSFVPSPECYRGDIDSLDPSRISWRQISSHPGPALYRSAAAGSGGQIVFFGGTDNPYNYNGVGYNGIPSEPRNGAFAYVAAEDRWEALAVQARPTMDHRALLTLAPGRWLVIGGMDESRELLSTTAPITAGVDL